MTAEELAAIDAWLADLEPGCDGWYIETRLVRALRDEVERLLDIARQVAQPPSFVALVPVYVTPEIFQQARALLAHLDSGVDKPGAGA